MSIRAADVFGAFARHSILLATSAFILLPFVWMALLSIKPPEEFFQADFSFFPQSFHGVENYSEAINRTPLLRFMWNGLLVCGVTLFLQILIAAPCAYALAKLSFPGRDALFMLVLVGLLIPHQVLAIPMFVAFYGIGILDTYAALIIPGIVSPFGIFLLRQFFKTVPDDLVHAARLDGLSEWQIVWNIMLPAALPAVIAFSLLSVIARWNDLFWPLILIRSEELMTPPMGIIHFRSEEAGTTYGPLMAAAVIIVIPLVLFFLIAQRRFVEGITISGLK